MSAQIDSNDKSAPVGAMFPQLEIPETLAAGPGPGNTDPRVLERFAAAGCADHMQADVVRGMKEAKAMLEAAKKGRIKHMVGFNYRRVPAVALAREMIEKGWHVL